jgi:hypothetical protein
MRTIFVTKNLKEGDHLGDLGIGERIIFKFGLGKHSWRVWIGFTCLKTGMGCRPTPVKI